MNYIADLEIEKALEEIQHLVKKHNGYDVNKIESGFSSEIAQKKFQEVFKKLMYGTKDPKFPNIHFSCCYNINLKNGTCSHQSILLPISKLGRCAHCKTTYYCCRKCQLEDWPIHKAICKKN